MSFVRTLLLATLASCTGVPAVAQDSVLQAAAAVVPHLVRYSGALPEAPSSAALATVRFAVYTAKTGGEPLWSEEQQVALDLAGKYSVLLGAVTPLPDLVFVAGEARWVGVTLAGHEEAARTPLTASAYALKAEDAQTLGGHPVSDFALAGVKPKPDAGTDITQVNVSSGILGGGTGPTVSLSADPAYFNANYAQLAAANSFSAANTFTKGFASTVATGTAPFTVASTTAVPNLDASLLGGAAAAAFPQLALQNTFTNNQIIGPSAPATTSTGHSSYFLWLNASVWNSSKSAAQNIGFQWRAEPLDNNTATPNANFALLSTVTSATPQETGFKITANGIVTFVSGQTFPGTVSLATNNTFTGANTFSSPITFASGQTFPGAGTITGVTAGSGLTGGGTSGVVTLALNTTSFNATYAQLNAANTFTDPQTIGNGDLILSDGNIDLPSTTSSKIGVVTLDTLPFLHAYTSSSSTPNNIFAGVSAGNFTMASGAIGETAIGASSMTGLTSGAYNTAAGQGSLPRTTTGAQNVALGYNAGASNTTGSNNTYVGENAGPDSGSTGLSYSAAIGAGAVVSESNAIALGGTSGNINAVKVGIGTATPQYTLDVQGTGNFTGAVTFAGANTFTGNQTITGNQTVNGQQTITDNNPSESVTPTPGSLSVSNTSTTGYGIYSTAQNVAIAGLASATSGTSIGVYGSASGSNTAAEGGLMSGYTGLVAVGSAAPVSGSTNGGIGVIAEGGYGVDAQSTESDNYGYGVYAAGGTAFAAASGGYAAATTGVGVAATGGVGVVATANDANSVGIGVVATGGSSNGGTGVNASGYTGVNATGDITGVMATGSYGMIGTSTGGFQIGVFGLGSSSGSTGTGVLGEGFQGAQFDGTCCSGGPVAATSTSGTEFTNGVGVLGGSGRIGVLGEPNDTGVSWGVVGLFPDFSGTYYNYISAEGVAFGAGSGAGVWGDAANHTADGSGVLATADGDTALIAVNNSTNPTAEIINETSTAGKVMFETSAPKVGSNTCTIDTSATLKCAGQTINVVKAQDGKQVAMYAMTSPENWHEDFGSGELQGGRTRISLEQIFGSAVNTDVEYHVFLTPKGDCKGLYVTNESKDGFEVRELSGGTSSVAFDYRIVAKRKGYETVRLEDQTPGLQEQAARAAAREERIAHPEEQAGGVAMHPAGKEIPVPMQPSGPLPGARPMPARRPVRLPVAGQHAALEMLKK